MLDLTTNTSIISFLFVAMSGANLMLAMPLLLPRQNIPCDLLQCCPFLTIWERVQCVKGFGAILAR